MKKKDDHFTALENMYLSAPVNEFFRARVDIAEAEATIEIDLSEKFFHAAEAVHGCVYFKRIMNKVFHLHG